MKRILSLLLLIVLLAAMLSGCGEAPEGYETVWVVSFAKGSNWRGEYTYNEKGLLLSEKQGKTDEGMQTAQWTYDEENREILYEDPANDFRRTTDYEKGVWVVWEKGKPRSGKLKSDEPVTDNAVYTYDDQGRVLKRVTRSQEQTYQYDAAGNVVFEGILDTLGRYWETRYTYDQNGNLLEERKKDPFSDSEEVVQCTYDDRGNRLSHCRTWGRTGFQSLTEYTYDAENRRLSSRTYCERKVGEPQVLKDEWLYIYDEEGRLAELTVRQHEGEVTILWTYDSHGNVRTLCRQGERPVRFTYRAVQVPTELAEMVRVQQIALQDRVKRECNMIAAINP